MQLFFIHYASQCACAALRDEYRMTDRRTDMKKRPARGKQIKKSPISPCKNLNILDSTQKHI